MKIAIVGATGAVGKELIRVLEKRKFPASEVVCFASERSVGKSVEAFGKKSICQSLKAGAFQGVKIAFFDASDEVSLKWVPQASTEGAWVVDNSGAFRMDEDIPLVVPEVNAQSMLPKLKEGVQGRQRIFSGPNCSTVQLVMALKPIADRWGLSRVIVSTYQSVSGAGALAIDETRSQTQAALQGQDLKPEVFPYSIAFNCIPQIGGFKSDGFTSEEQKIMAEARKILGLPRLAITATAIRVPTLRSHAESVYLETERPFGSEHEVREALARFPGIVVLDDPSAKSYPMNIRASGEDEVYVGRIRRDPNVDKGLNLWVVSDNLRKGAATNAVQIGELLIGKEF